MNQLKYVLFLFCASLCCAQEPIRARPSDWAQPMLGTDLANFYKVSDNVFRSRQPANTDMKMLEKLGIKSILNLRDFHDDQDEAKSTKLKLYQVSMSAGEIKQETIKKALEIIRDAEKPILIHCWHGSDRTGVVIAMHRMVHQDWPRQKAIDEFENGGFGFHKKTYPNILEYLKTAKIEDYKIPKLNPPAASSVKN